MQYFCKCTINIFLFALCGAVAIRKTFQEVSLKYLQQIFYISQPIKKIKYQLILANYFLFVFLAHSWHIFSLQNPLGFVFERVSLINYMRI